MSDVLTHWTWKELAILLASVKWDKAQALPQVFTEPLTSHLHSCSFLNWGTCDDRDPPGEQPHPVFGHTEVQGSRLSTSAPGQAWGWSLLKPEPLVKQLTAQSSASFSVLSSFPNRCIPWPWTPLPLSWLWTSPLLLPCASLNTSDESVSHCLFPVGHLALAQVQLLT